MRFQIVIVVALAAVFQCATAQQQSVGYWTPNQQFPAAEIAEELQRGAQEIRNFVINMINDISTIMKRILYVMQTSGLLDVVVPRAGIDAARFFDVIQRFIGGLADEQELESVLTPASKRLIEYEAELWAASERIVPPQSAAKSVADEL